VERLAHLPDVGADGRGRLLGRDPRRAAETYVAPPPIERISERLGDLRVPYPTTPMRRARQLLSDNSRATSEAASEESRVQTESRQRLLSGPHSTCSCPKPCPTTLLQPFGGSSENTKAPRVRGFSMNSGGRIRTCDLRVMSRRRGLCRAMWGLVSSGYDEIGLGWDRLGYVGLRAPFRAPPLRDRGPIGAVRSPLPPALRSRSLRITSPKKWSRRSATRCCPEVPSDPAYQQVPDVLHSVCVWAQRRYRPASNPVAGLW
jgi:hypothetical protein